MNGDFDDFIIAMTVMVMQIMVLMIVVSDIMNEILQFLMIKSVMMMT